MPNRTSTLLRENAIDLGKYPLPKGNALKELNADMTRIQNEILYENKPDLFDTCIICDKKVTGKRSDHYLSAVKDKMPRFRDGFLLATGHPMNMVYCCRDSKCNNEVKKQKRLEEQPRLRAYYEYVLANCPTVSVTQGEFEELNRMTIQAEKERLERVQALRSKESAGRLKLAD
jgi:hypothetical protein